MRVRMSLSLRMWAVISTLYFIRGAYPSYKIRENEECCNPCLSKVHGRVKASLALAKAGHAEQARTSSLQKPLKESLSDVVVPHSLGRQDE